MHGEIIDPFCKHCGKKKIIPIKYNYIGFGLCRNIFDDGSWMFYYAGKGLIRQTFYTIYFCRACGKNSLIRNFSRFLDYYD